MTGARRVLRRVMLDTGVGFWLLLLNETATWVLLSVLGVESLVVGEPGTPWSVLAFEGSPDGDISSSVNPVGLLSVSSRFGYLLALVSVPRRPDSETERP